MLPRLGTPCSCRGRFGDRMPTTNLDTDTDLDRIEILEGDLEEARFRKDHQMAVRILAKSVQERVKLEAKRRGTTE